MTINGPAAILLAFFLAAAEKQGIDWAKVGGTIQNDVLKEYIAQNSYLIPPEPAMKIVVDMIEFCTKHVPRWNTISISGYHIREAGSTAVQELAFTLADGIAYVDACIKRGLAIDDFAPRLSFFFNSHSDLFEEVAKFRENSKDKKVQVTSNQTMKAMADQMKELKTEITENKDILGQELADYYKESGSMEITDEDGNVKRIVFSVKLING